MSSLDEWSYTDDPPLFVRGGLAFYFQDATGAYQTDPNLWLVVDGDDEAKIEVPSGWLREVLTVIPQRRAEYDRQEQRALEDLAAEPEGPEPSAPTPLRLMVGPYWGGVGAVDDDLPF